MNTKIYCFRNENAEESERMSSHITVRPSTSASNNNRDHAEFCKCLALSIAYSANIGGTGTLTGTPPNLVFKNVAEELVRQVRLRLPLLL